jgi:hypothetical protein
MGDALLVLDMEQRAGVPPKDRVVRELRRQDVVDLSATARSVFDYTPVRNQ